MWLVTKETSEHLGIHSEPETIRSARGMGHRCSPGQSGLYFWALEEGATFRHSGSKVSVGQERGQRCLQNPNITLSSHSLTTSKHSFKLSVLKVCVANCHLKVIFFPVKMFKTHFFLKRMPSCSLYFYHKLCSCSFYSLPSFSIFLLTFIYRWEVLKAFSFAEYKNSSVTEILRRANYVYHAPLPSTLFVITGLELNKKLR